MTIYSIPLSSPKFWPFITAENLAIHTGRIRKRVIENPISSKPRKPYLHDKVLEEGHSLSLPPPKFSCLPAKYFYDRITVVSEPTTVMMEIRWNLFRHRTLTPFRCVKNTEQRSRTRLPQLSLEGTQRCELGQTPWVLARSQKARIPCLPRVAGSYTWWSVVMAGPVHGPHCSTGWPNPGSPGFLTQEKCQQQWAKV